MPSAPPAKSSANGCLIILVVFLLLIVAAIAGLYVMNSFQIPTGFPQMSMLSKLPGLPGVPGMGMPRAKESDFAFIDDPLIRKHFAAQANERSFRITTKADIGKTGSLQVNEMQLVGDVMHTHSWQVLDGKRMAEIIMIGETTYVKDEKDGAWWKQTLKPEAQKEIEGQMEIKAEDFKDEYMQDRKLTYKKVGEEACGSLTCHKYEEGDPENKEANRIFWFDTNKLLLRREESGFGEWRGTTEYEYERVNVKAPSPTKDVPEGKNIYEYMYLGAMPNLMEPQAQQTTQYTAPRMTAPPEDTYEAPQDYYDEPTDYPPEEY